MTKLESSRILPRQDFRPQETAGTPELDGDCWRKVGEYLPNKDLVALASTGRAMRQMLWGDFERRQALPHLHRHLLGMNNLHEFRAFLKIGHQEALPNTLWKLPVHQQSEVLTTAAYRILAFPENDRQEAWVLFLSAFKQIPENKLSPDLQALRQAVDSGTDAIRTLQAEFSRLAARDGGTVRYVAQRFGITSKRGIKDLEYIVIHGPAGQAVRDGSMVQVVARRFGITSERGINALEYVAINGPAGQSVRDGGLVQVVAQRFGITSKRGISSLNGIVITGPARRALRNGETLRRVAKSFDITNRDDIVRLWRLVEPNANKKQIMMRFWLGY